MKALLVAEYREGKLLESIYELAAFAELLNAEKVIFAVGNKDDLPALGSNVKTYLADSSKYTEYNPSLHRDLLLKVIEAEKPDYIVFHHSSYGWDLAPRISAKMKVAQYSEVVGVENGSFVMPFCNNKLRKVYKSNGKPIVLTIQGGAFQAVKPSEKAGFEMVDIDTASQYQFKGYEEAEKKDVDLTKAQIIVSAGRGIGKKDNVVIVESLAKALGGELGASRPVVDAGWVPHSRQVGTTGQTVSPKLYVACGISGAIQHLAGMKKAEHVLAINVDKDAPIGEVAELLVVADLNQFIPVLIETLKK
ncbi:MULTISPECIES: electron transfer flavoprotein subunit alpha/FixB family protein [Calditerrivibrio]|jgi:electron transfer flavoprotein alpha subunit|uniref:electron transfer flavoprotein subunit alpha/FixB family protein n=1 Tax=Calditerrivibrio TaxID=545865 RepID=UPI003C748794